MPSRGCSCALHRRSPGGPGWTAGRLASATQADPNESLAARGRAFAWICRPGCRRRPGPPNRWPDQKPVRQRRDPSPSCRAVTPPGTDADHGRRPTEDNRHDHACRNDRLRHRSRHPSRHPLGRRCRPHRRRHRPDHAGGRRVRLPPAARLRACARPTRRVWAIEGTGSFGAGLTTYLLEQGEWVVEIDRPARPARRNGAKTDGLDAVRAAREALAREHLAAPRRRGDREAMRVLVPPATARWSPVPRPSASSRR
jgi:hypothetical protein